MERLLRKRILRTISLLLCLMIFFTMFPCVPGNVFADWIENGEQCMLCQEWDEADAICDECYCHYDDCSGVYTHCQSCGRCFATGDDEFCPDCGYCYLCVPHCAYCGACDPCETCDVCEECAESLQTHCTECKECLASADVCPEHGVDGGHCSDCALAYRCNDCGKCLFEDQDDFCEQCHMCIDCAINNMYHCGYCEGCCDDDVVCEYCGKCDDCAQSDGVHCPICNKCYEGETELCSSGGEHCIDCCNDEGWICPQCGECAEGKGIEICLMNLVKGN